MNKLLAFFGGVAIVTSVGVATTAMAQQPYVGVAVMTPGEASWTYAAGKTVENSDHLLAKKIYGGIDLDNTFGLELGYSNWGYQFRIPTVANNQTTTHEAQIKVNMLYVAGKASMTLSDKIRAFTKLGLARTHTDFNGAATGNTIRGLVGFGVDYSITKELALSIEFDRAGSINRVPQQKLEAGVKYTF